MLTGREIQVASLISQGMIEKEIADKMNLAPATVHTYKYRILQKLQAHNIADITRIYIHEYDTAIRTRITRSYYAGRRTGIVAGWLGARPHKPSQSIQGIRTEAGNLLAEIRPIEAGSAEYKNLLFALRIAEGKYHQLNENNMKVRNDEMMQKIDSLMWLNQNLDAKQLRRVVDIAKELKQLEP